MTFSKWVNWSWHVFIARKLFKRLMASHGTADLDHAAQAIHETVRIRPTFSTATCQTRHCRTDLHEQHIIYIHLCLPLGVYTRWFLRFAYNTIPLSKRCHVTWPDNTRPISELKVSLACRFDASPQPAKMTAFIASKYAISVLHVQGQCIGHVISFGSGTQGVEWSWHQRRRSFIPVMCSPDPVYPNLCAYSGKQISFD